MDKVFVVVTPGMMAGFADEESANTHYTVSVAANQDASRHTLPVDRWPAVVKVAAGEDPPLEILDFTAS